MIKSTAVYLLSPASPSKTPRIIQFFVEGSFSRRMTAKMMGIISKKSRVSGISIKKSALKIKEA